MNPHNDKILNFIVFFFFLHISHGFFFLDIHLYIYTSFNFGIWKEISMELHWFIYKVLFHLYLQRITTKNLPNKYLHF